VRVGGNVIPMHSTNGFTWTQIGNLPFSQLPRTAYVGMAVSNHPDSGSVKATAQFRDVALEIGVPGAPAILLQPTSQIVNPGSDVALNVTAVGRGTLAYQWFRNGSPIDGATNAAYILQSVQESDEGKVTCLVRNESGEALSWAGLLEVEEAHQPFDGILLERYNRVYGRRVEYMVNATNYPSAPFAVSQPTVFEISSLSDDTGARLRGYVTAPLTGEYTFYIAADDRGELWLSSDDNPGNKGQIAECYYWVGLREWDFYQSQISAPIRLQTGQRYYLEAVIKGEGSPNHGSVGWRMPDGKFERPIPASRFRGQAATVQSIGRNSSGSFELRVEGTSDSLYVIQASTNLTTWSPVLTNRVPFLLEDAETASYPHRFYRVMTSR